jgi:acetylornithine deacetylase/succinyl-diaminopimelate desuccinylase-like protein
VTDPSAEVTDLLQHLIRNACVNDGTPASGGEARSADLLAGYFDGSGVDIGRYEPAPGRANLVVRIEGRRADAPTLVLLGHTDVVPASPDRWRHDPFGGELVDGEVWGRGAVDMLNLTASMAVATRRLATTPGFRPDGTLVYVAVADEEALGTWGADHLTRHEPDAVQGDYVVTESGGIPVATGDGAVGLPVMVGEKGSCWCTLRVTGTPGHASLPYATDNALVTAARVVDRLASFRPAARITETWRRFLAARDLPADLTEALLDPDRLDAALADLPVGTARQFHSCTHTTIAPTVVHGGTKTNVIPDRVDLQLDVRTLPGETFADVQALLDEALGDLAGRVEVLEAFDDPATESPVDTPLWHSLGRVTRAFYADSHLVPMMNVGATDARFFRRLGTTSYGFGLFSRRLTFDDFGRMFHGDDERVDVESLRLSTDMWQALAHDVLGG